MKMTLEKTGWKDYRPWKAKPGSKAGSLAWSNRETGIITVRRGCASLSRLGNEMEHCLDEKFNNPDHHEWHHFCIRSYFPFRLWRHHEKARKEWARTLKKHGMIQVFP